MTGAGQGATTPTLTIDTRGDGDKDLIVTGGNLYIRVDFDDVDHTAVAREIGLVVDANNAHTTLLLEVGRLKAALDKYGWHKHRCAAIDDDCTDVRYPEIECTCGLDAALSPASGGV